MTDRSPLHLLAFYGPLVLIGVAAGALRALARRPGLPDATRRAYGIGWVLLLFLGTPLWFVLAATLRL